MPALSWIHFMNVYSTHSWKTDMFLITFTLQGRDMLFLNGDEYHLLTAPVALCCCMRGLALPAMFRKSCVHRRNVLLFKWCLSFCSNTYLLLFWGEINVGAWLLKGPGFWREAGPAAVPEGWASIHEQDLLGHRLTADQVREMVLVTVPLSSIFQRQSWNCCPALLMISQWKEVTGVQAQYSSLPTNSSKAFRYWARTCLCRDPQQSYG